MQKTFSYFLSFLAVVQIMYAPVTYANQFENQVIKQLHTAGLGTNKEQSFDEFWSKSRRKVSAPVRQMIDAWTLLHPNGKLPAYSITPLNSDGVRIMFKVDSQNISMDLRN